MSFLGISALQARSPFVVSEDQIYLDDLCEKENVAPTVEDVNVKGSRSRRTVDSSLQLDSDAQSDTRGGSDMNNTRDQKKQQSANGI